MTQVIPDAQYFNKSKLNPQADLYSLIMPKDVKTIFPKENWNKIIRQINLPDSSNQKNFNNLELLLKNIDQYAPSRWRYDSEFSGQEGYWTRDVTYARRLHGIFGNSLPITVTGNVLDLGCNIGVTTEELCEFLPNARVMGIDISKTSIEAANSRPNRSAKYELMDGYKSQYPDNSFDAVFCNNNVSYVVPTVSEDKGTEIIQGITRLVKPNGYLVLSEGGASIDASKYVVYQKIDDRFNQITNHGYSDVFIQRLSRFLDSSASRTHIVQYLHSLSNQIQPKTQVN